MEKITNMEEINDTLDLNNVQYANQSKGNNYLLWKFKKKWRLLAEVNSKYNIVKSEFKLTGRKKKRRKLNMLMNLFEVGRKFINNIDLNIIVNKQHLCLILKLYKKMHNSDRYFESVNNRKFQFYSQLIERYRNFIITPRTNYLLLNSSNITYNEHLKRGETIKIINNSITFNNIFEPIIAKKEKNNIEYKHVLFMKSENLLKVNETTDEIIGTIEKDHSIKIAQPLRSKIQTEGMSSNLRDETIPIAYSRFLDIWNDKQEKQID
jgi:hypothetical protein